MFGFEILERDLLARIGRLRTKGGTVETPVFLPVVNPNRDSIAPREMWTDFGCKMLITNAYIIKKNLEELTKKEGVKGILDFPGIVMTDSGAYQILAYGRVDVKPGEIVRFQEEIDTDIATILDIPTGWKISKEHAQETVEQTISRAKDLERQKTRDGLAWVGPIQGGRYLNLVARSAQEMANLPFEIHALGSPTPVMEQYLFHVLVDMIITAKMNLPASRPLHLFGAGHPFMFSLAVALGCDMFDSAAYSIFAREGRYLTEHGTLHLEELEYLPCSCPVCVKRDPEDLGEMPRKEREKELSRHNLHVCFSEMREIKQSIIEGRLWEHLEMRAYGHPSLLRALKTLGKYSDYLERNSPVSKRNGLFFYSSVDLIRPEVIRYKKRLRETYLYPQDAPVLVLVPDLRPAAAGRSRRFKKAIRVAQEKFNIETSKAHVCAYAPPFGVIPHELEDIYPLGQYEYAHPPDLETIEYISQEIMRFIEDSKYDRHIMLFEKGSWSTIVSEKCRQICFEQNMKLELTALHA